MTAARVREVVSAHRPRAMVVPDPSKFRHASVLVPLVVADPLRVILTVRPDGMATHAGQIAFPGGRRDDCDADEVACALREAEEEIGLARGAVEVVGRLDQFATPSGYLVAPVVGLVAPGAPLQPSAREVAEVFEVALPELAAPGAFRQLGERAFLGVRQQLVEYVVGERRIWGITARVLQQLLGLLG